MLTVSFTIWITILIGFTLSASSKEDSPVPETSYYDENNLFELVEAALDSYPIDLIAPVIVKESSPFISRKSYSLVMSLNEDWENELSTSMSNVSESFLEELGLRSRPTTPLPSPSQNLRKMVSSCSSLSSLIFSSGKQEESQDSGTETEGVDGISFDSEYRYQFDFIEIDDLMEGEENPALASTEEIQPPVTKTLDLAHVPNSILTHIMEYCSDASLLDIRLVDKKFKENCDIYLNYLANLTLKPGQAAQASFDFKYSLSSTMMPFYKNQIQVRELLSLLFKSEKPWNFMSLTEVSNLKGFNELAIFSNEFIKDFVLPGLLLLPRNNPTEPSPIFLLAEALLRSKRIQFFNVTVLPILNRVAVEMVQGIPVTELISPGFLDFHHEGQIVLGATLHAAISFNLNLTVMHLIRLQPDAMNFKNHYGITAFLKIVEYLGENRGTVQVDEDHINEWMEKTALKFAQRNPIQENFGENSYLAVEIFLGILNQITERLSNREETVEFLGINQVYTIIAKVPGGAYCQRTTTLLHELVQAQQYDLIFSLGFFFGDLIESSQLDINPLHMAAEMNDPALVAILLKFYVNIDVNALTASGSTAIGLVVGKRLRSLKVLLADPRADPNLNNSVSPLIRSIEIGNAEAVELLLNHPAIDIHHQIIRNSKTLSPLGAAVARRKWNILQLLLSTPDSNYSLYQNSPAFLQILKEAERALIKLGDDYYDLMMMVRRLILPTIEE